MNHCHIKYDDKTKISQSITGKNVDQDNQFRYHWRQSETSKKFYNKQKFYRRRKKKRESNTAPFPVQNSKHKQSTWLNWDLNTLRQRNSSSWFHRWIGLGDVLMQEAVIGQTLTRFGRVSSCWVRRFRVGAAQGIACLTGACGPVWGRWWYRWLMGRSREDLRQNSHQRQSVSWPIENKPNPSIICDTSTLPLPWD